MKLGTNIKHDQTLAEINNGHFTYIFCGIIPLCNFQYRNRVHSITLIPFEIISQNLVEISSMTVDVQRLSTVAPPAFLAELFPFVIFPIKLCPLYNLIPFEIIS